MTRNINLTLIIPILFNTKRYLLPCMMPYVVILLLTSCIDPFNYGNEKQEKPFLVVDGFISNEKKLYTVSLKRSANFLAKTTTYNGFIKEEGFNKPESKAIVKIIDQNGKELRLWETERGSGIYQSSNLNWQGKIGNKYYLSILTKDGKQYQSKPEILHSSSKIRDVYYKLEKHKTLNSSNYIEDAEGIQYYTDIDVGKDEFYLFTNEETYIMEQAFDNSVHCYVTGQGDLNHKVLASNNYSKSKIDSFSLNFVIPDIKYNVKYSYHLKKYSISPDAYAFFNAINKQLATKGTILDATPSKITGNIFNTEDSNEIVLGYFGAYGVSSKRTFISFNDLPKKFKKGVLNICFTLCPPLSSDCPPKYCSDCALFPGSSKAAPDFWE